VVGGRSAAASACVGLNNRGLEKQNELGQNTRINKGIYLLMRHMYFLQHNQDFRHCRAVRRVFIPTLTHEVDKCGVEMLWDGLGTHLLGFGYKFGYLCRCHLGKRTHSRKDSKHHDAKRKDCVGGVDAVP
jgi:hypothetical protein